MRSKFEVTPRKAIKSGAKGFDDETVRDWG